MNLFTLQTVIETIRVKPAGTDCFVAQNPKTNNRVTGYGGLAVAQGVMAACLTLPEYRKPSSVHAYFIRPAVVDEESFCEVSRDMDGRTMSHRNVNITQRGKTIMRLSVAFHAQSTGPEAQFVNPDDFYELDKYGPVGPGNGCFEQSGIFELRSAPIDLQPNIAQYAPRNIWLKPKGIVPSERYIREALIAYFTDMGVAFSGMKMDGYDLFNSPSLDHSVWFHNDTDINQWMFTSLRPVALSSGRGFYTGGLYTQDKKLIASFSQEILIKTI